MIGSINIINGSLSSVVNIFTKPQLGNFNTILKGMFKEGKKSLLSISKEIIGSNNQSNLNRFLNQSDWNEKDLNNIRLEILNNNKELKIKKNGFFVLDDTLIEKFGKKMEGVGNLFDHTDGKYKNARNIMMLFYVEPIIETNKSKEKINYICYPIDIRKYYKIEEIGEIDFKTKNELALEMIFEHMPKEEKNQPTILFDSWFSGKDFLKSLDDKGYKFITVGKSNRNIFVNKVKKKVPDLFIHSNVALGELEGFEKELVFIKGEDKDVYLISNINGLKQEDYLNLYSNRWNIEVGFKDFKQLFGWKDMSFKSSLAVLRMIYISFFSYTISMKELFKEKNRDNKKSIGNICKKIRDISFIGIIKKIYGYFIKNIPLDSVIKNFGF